MAGKLGGLDFLEGPEEKPRNSPFSPNPNLEARLTFAPTALQPTDVNWQVESNKQSHHTSKFYSPELIVRRGQPFTVALGLNRAMEAGETVTFTVATGPNPSESARTKAVFQLSGPAVRGGWSAAPAGSSASGLSASITSPPNSPVGRYQLSVQISSRGKVSSVALGPFVQLFNPWLKEDSVFLNSEAEREEYVLKDYGIIYVGSVNRIDMVGWNYGQFEEDVLNVCLSVLDRSLNFQRDPATDVARRNDPKYVGRVLSGMVNGNDDSGVLAGNWSGEYAGGRDPRNWNGSVEILKEWKKTGYQPVRYGQCWVFAGTLNTVLRCLGIPARVITNFNSAHDTDRNLTVDVYYDPLGNPLDKGSDSVWNFHVWNEGWFLRTDLGPSYNGWQVLDATPQERSQGVFQCGPSSVAAIRAGDVQLDFDAPFVFAEVNADRITWVYDAADGSQRQSGLDASSVGRFISTKAVGTDARLDLTERYKFPEGSTQEREVFKKALGQLRPSMGFSSTASAEEEARPARVAGKFKVVGALEVGQEVNLVLLLRNLSRDLQAVTVNRTAWTIVYNGTLVHEVWRDSLTASLEPEEEVELPIKIPYAQYAEHLTADNMIRVTAVCRVTDGGEVVVGRDVILDNPAITLEVPDHAKVKTPMNVLVLFANPLAEPVENCVLMVEGSGLMRGNLKIDVPSLRPKQRSRVQFEIVPIRSGANQLLIDFSCNKFPAIKAFVNIDVSE
ncbi:protein-glutamine gamma-glutamyltransferase E [Tachyglossus aculeatus]|uniref:protein-glutamine gamma-glutamyltransferase E n=1 Tax=Tachyglossus aculeatus TaxID=9261 RepID=UPI0018F6F384|nr:protein-glutamine gamma-glutamyltransferase E [Tachyglossus aculeatus]